MLLYIVIFRRLRNFSLIRCLTQMFRKLRNNLKKRQQPVDDFNLLFSIPWDHHRRISDKCKDDMDKALFFVRKTWENNWGRDALLNWLDTDLYERDGKAVTNFQSTLSQKDFKSSMRLSRNWKRVER